jgi:CHAD domain-containing protein
MGVPGKATFPLLRYLDELVKDLQTRLEKAAHHSKPQDVHKGRIAARRLKAAIDVLRPVVSDKRRKPLARAGKKIRRRLGPMRDSDIMLTHLDEVGRNSRYAAAASWLAEQIKIERENIQEELSLKRLSRLCKDLQCWDDFRKDIADAPEAIASLLAQSVHLQLDALIEQAKAHEAKQSDSDIHGLRIAFKKLRYTIELAQESGQKLPNGMLKTFKRVQDALGLWHDFVVIVEQGLECSTQKQLAVRNAQMQQKILSIVDHFLRLSLAQLDRFQKLWDEYGNELANLLREQFPLEAAATKSKKDRGRRRSKRIVERAIPAADAASNGQA